MDINNPITKGAGRSEDRGSRIWLITFTDLVALMLTFFVMLFAMSSVKVSEWKNIIDSLSQTLRPSDEQPVPAATSTFNIGTIFRKQAINLDYLSSVLNETVKGQPLLSAGHILRLEGRLIITFRGDLLFEEGGATMTDRGRRSLFVLGGVLQNIGNQVGARYSFLDPPSNIGELVVRSGIIVRYRFSIVVAAENFRIYWYGVDCCGRSVGDCEWWLVGCIVRGLSGDNRFRSGSGFIKFNRRF